MISPQHSACFVEGPLYSIYPVNVICGAGNAIFTNDCSATTGKCIDVVIGASGPALNAYAVCVAI